MPLFKGEEGSLLDPFNNSRNTPPKENKPDARRKNELSNKTFSTIFGKRELKQDAPKEARPEPPQEVEGVFGGGKKRIRRSEFIHELEKHDAAVHLKKEEKRKIGQELPTEYYDKVGIKDVKREIKGLKTEEYKAGSHEDKARIHQEISLLKKKMEDKP